MFATIITNQMNMPALRDWDICPLSGIGIYARDDIYARAAGLELNDMPRMYRISLRARPVTLTPNGYWYGTYPGWVKARAIIMTLRYSHGLQESSGCN